LAEVNPDPWGALVEAVTTTNPNAGKGAKAFVPPIARWRLCEMKASKERLSLVQKNFNPSGEIGLSEWLFI
jgi:hypothetical protein